MSRIGFHRRDYLKPADDQPPAETTPRRCLRCQAPFESAWAGERVCAKCKTSRVWRDGVGVNMGSWSR